MSAWKMKLSIPITIVWHNFGLAFRHFKSRELIKNHTLQHTWFIHSSGERIFLQAVLCTCQQWDITDAAVIVPRTLHRAEKSFCSIFGMLSRVCQIGMWKLSQITQTSQVVLILLIYYEPDNPHPHSPIMPYPAVHGWGCGWGGPALASTSIYFKGRAEHILFFFFVILNNALKRQKAKFLMNFNFVPSSAPCLIPVQKPYHFIMKLCVSPELPHFLKLSLGLVSVHHLSITEQFRQLNYCAPGQRWDGALWQR